MLVMLIIQALLGRLGQLLMRSKLARRVALVATVGVMLAVALRTSPPAGPADAEGAAGPQAAASASPQGPCAALAADQPWIELARRGDMDALVALADGGGGGANDAQAYKWLVAAADFGHLRAQVLMNSLLETTSLRFDDDGLVVGTMHHELGLSYASTCESLPHNLYLARRHLMLGREGVMGTQRDWAADRRGLSEAALKVFDEVFPPEVLAATGSAGSAADASRSGPSAPLATPPELSARMVDFGLYRSAHMGRRQDARVAGGLIYSLGRELLRQTDQVPATIGSGFGFRYVLQGQGEDAEVTVRVLHPVPLRDPESGRSIAVSEWQQRLPLGQVNWNSGWNFDHPWELVPGRWTIQLHGGSNGQSRLLLEKHFEVVAP